jgi:hypothetical protein
MTQNPPPANEAEGTAARFRLVAGVKRGIGSDFDETWKSYPTVDAARIAGQALSRNERVAHVLIARDDVPPEFVEWVT